MLLCCFRIDQSVLPARDAWRLQHLDSGRNRQHKRCSNIARVPPHDARQHTLCPMGGNGGWKHHDDRPCIGLEWCATFLWCCCCGCGAPIASQVWRSVPCLQNMRGQFCLSCYCLLQLLVTAVTHFLWLSVSHFLWLSVTHFQWLSVSHFLWLSVTHFLWLLLISCYCHLLIFCYCYLFPVTVSYSYSFPGTVSVSYSFPVTVISCYCQLHISCYCQLLISWYCQLFPAVFSDWLVMCYVMLHLSWLLVGLNQMYPSTSIQS